MKKKIPSQNGSVKKLVRIYKLAFDILVGTDLEDG